MRCFGSIVPVWTRLGVGRRGGTYAPGRLRAVHQRTKSLHCNDAHLADDPAEQLVISHYTPPPNQPHALPVPMALLLAGNPILERPHGPIRRDISLLSPVVVVEGRRHRNAQHLLCLLSRASAQTRKERNSVGLSSWSVEGAQIRRSGRERRIVLVPVRCAAGGVVVVLDPVSMLYTVRWSCTMLMGMMMRIYRLHDDSMESGERQPGNR